MLKINIEYEVFNGKLRLGSLSGGMFISHDNNTNFTLQEIQTIEEAMIKAAAHEKDTN